MDFHYWGVPDTTEYFRHESILKSRREFQSLPHYSNTPILPLTLGPMHSDNLFLACSHAHTSHISLVRTGTKSERTIIIYKSINDKIFTITASTGTTMYVSVIIVLTYLLFLFEY